MDVDALNTDATRCPLCGESNECGMAQGQSDCWCFTAVIPPEVIERVPDAQRGLVCVCAKCAARASEQRAAQDDHAD